MAWRNIWEIMGGGRRVRPSVVEVFKTQKTPHLCIKEPLDSENLARNALKGGPSGIVRLQYTITLQSQVSSQMIP